MVRCFPWQRGVMRTSFLLVALLVTVFCLQQTNGLFFYLREGQTKCFLEDLPKDTVVIVQVDATDLREGAIIAGDTKNDIYRRKNADTQAIGIVGQITTGKEVVVEQTVAAKGRFAFTSQTPGEYSICLRTNSSHWFGSGSIRLDVNLQVGDANTNDYEEIKALEQLSDLEVLIRRLNDRVVDIRKEQAYYRYREEKLRDESELANSNVMWFSLLQTFVLLASGMWQIFHLKSFFKAKKMV